MLRAHSLLWHYFWLAPDILQAGLAVFIYRRGLHKRFPAFFVYTIYEAIQTFTLYTMDILPSVSAQAWWRTFWVSLIIDGLVKFAVLGELFGHLLRVRPTLARTGNRLFCSAGAALALLAAVIAAFTTSANPQWVVGGALILQQSLYIIHCGLILFVFLFAARFGLSWDRTTFGIAIGFGIVFCQHLAAWATETGVALPDHGVLLDFLNMATYHVCVLIWCYYLLIPGKIEAKPAVPLPENNLEIWNRELERLLQQ